MNKESLEQVIDQLLATKSALLNKQNNFVESSLNEKSSKGDDADLASNSTNLNLSIRLQERDQLLIKKIDYALAKIKGGSFGICDQCEEDLDSKRLLARPYANLCISCKEDQEHFQKMYA